MTNLNEAAVKLLEELRRHHIRLVAVGVRDSTQDIVVYVTRITPTVKLAVPEKWMGFQVTVIKSGPIRVL